MYLALGDERLTSVRLRVPARGAWVAEVDCEGVAAGAVGRSVLHVGGLALTGSVEPEQSGVIGTQRKLRMTAGAGEWGVNAGPRGYHNDAGVKARLVAEDLAREAGETLGEFRPERERLGVDYVRGAELSRAGVLEDVIGAVAWWVDADGLTQVGQRPTPPALVEGSYQVAAYDPRERLVTLTVSDPSVIAIGSVIVGPALPDAQTVREYEIRADSTSVRVLAWTGGDPRGKGRLAELWRAVTARTAGARLYGLYLYRVVSMAPGGGNRVSLQAVHRATGLPDIEPIPQWPGIPGVYADLALGAEVLVAFVEGDRTRPVVTHYSGQGGAGFVPSGIVIGGDDGPPAARQSDTVEVLLPPLMFTGTILVNGVPSPATGVMTAPLTTTLGSITTGSSKVRIAS